MAFYQGELDGLCGMYAIVNAIQLCDSAIDTDEVFQLACTGIAQSAWPAVLWEGTSRGQLQKMIKNITQKHPKITAKYPFSKNAPVSPAAFWTEFNRVFEEEAAVCAIVRIAEKISADMHHWTVIEPVGEKIKNTDSTANAQFATKYRKSLHPGERRKNTRQTLIIKEDLIVFYVNRASTGL
jgi:hypothetical protein